MSDAEMTLVWFEEVAASLMTGEIGHIENVRFYESPIHYPQLSLPQRSRTAQWKRDAAKFRYSR